MDSLTEAESAQVERNMTRWALILIFACLLIATSTLISWMLAIPVLDFLGMRYKPMNPIAALCSFMVALSILLGIKYKGKRVIYVSTLLYLFPLVIAVIKLIDSYFGLETKIDELLFKDTMTRVYYKSMSTVGIFCVLSLALVLTLDLWFKRIKWLYYSVVLFSFFIGTISLLGYLFGVARFYLFTTNEPLALAGSLVFLLLSLSILFKDKRQGLFGFLTGNYEGSKNGRRVLPAVIFVPILLGYIFQLGHRYQWLSAETGVAIMVVCMMLIFIVVLSLRTEALNKSDKERVKAELSEKRINDNLERLIAERTKELEASLKETSDYKFALNASSIISFTDLKGTIIAVNDNFCKISKYTREELIGQNHRIVNSGYHDHAFFHDLWATIGRGYIWRNEVRNKAKDGTFYWVDNTIVPFLDKRGKPYQYISIRTDITRKRLTNELLRQSDLRIREKEEQFRMFFEQSPAAMAMLDNSMRYVLVSKSWNLLFGLGDMNLEGKLHEEGFHDKRAETIEVLKKGMTGLTYTKEMDTMVNAAGKVIYYNWSSHPWYNYAGKIGGIIISAQELTGEVEAEKKFRDLVEQNLVGVFILKNERFEYVNPHFVELFGYDEIELKKMGLKDLLIHDEIELEKEFSGELIGNKIQSSHYFVQGKTRKGNKLWLEVFTRNSQYQGATSIMGTIIDITDRKNMEDRLSNSEANLRSIFDNTTIGFMLLDDQFVIRSFNLNFEQGCKNIFGKKPEINTSYLDLLTEDRKQFVLDQFVAVLKSHKPIEYELNFNMDGNHIYYHINVIPVDSDGDVIGLCVSVNDVTSRRQMELKGEALNYNLTLRNKELEQFAYIVSHNLRSPVANIMGLAGILNEEDVNPNDVKPISNELIKSAERLDGVVKDLNLILQIKKGSEDKKVKVVLSEMVAGIVESIHSMVIETQTVIEFDFKNCDEIFTIKGYLHSVFYNLITNAIKYRRPEVPCLINIVSRKEQGSIIIDISDNGLGMDLEKMGDQVFGLYKRFHRNIEGKGVGLYIVKTQVESMNGTITVASKVNAGTTFSITFQS